jgi:uncharacterized protein YjiS (DUF1127 family)
MSTTRQQGPQRPVSDSELYDRLYAFGLGRARLLRAVAVRRAWHAVLDAVLALLQRGGDRVWTWQNRYSARRHMAELDARLRDDVGLSRAHVMRAASRPFWKA